TFPMRLESIDGVADQWCAEAAMGRGFDELVAFPERVRALTPAAVQAAARKWFDPTHLTFVVVGPTDKLTKTIAAIAPIASEHGSRTPAQPQEADKRGRELVTKAIAAHGGLATLRKIRDSVLEADATARLAPNEAKA